MLGKEICLFCILTKEFVAGYVQGSTMLRALANAIAVF